MSKWHHLMRRLPHSRARYYSAIFKRDRGFCKFCGKDNTRLFEVIKSSGPELRRFLLESHRIHPKRYRDAVRARFGRLWEIDHIVPLSRDGVDTLDNIRTLCIQCHNAVTRLFLFTSK